MSLVVSLRVPDGIVVATDSQSTARRAITITPDAVKCPNCGTEVPSEDAHGQRINVPFSASSYTQKLFPIGAKFAVSSIGLGVLNQRSIYYHIKQFERKESVEDLRLKDLLDKFAEYLEDELLRENPSYKEDFPEQHHPYGFHVNGFEDDEEGRPVGITYELFIGKKRNTRRRDTLGCTVGGNMDVVRQLWDIGKEDPSRQFRYNLLSLQDAVDLGTFLIDVTSKFQRFARDIQTVGGDIDIALLTPFHGFQWIERKNLMATIEPKGSIEQWKEIDD